MPSERTWHKGPPPHVGWWNASRISAPNSWRWWDGSQWSAMAFPGDDTDTAARIAATPEPKELGPIKWSNYWPENARVPRLDPTAGDWTFHHGGPCPDFGGAERVQACFRDGQITSGFAQDARDCRWSHSDSVPMRNGDIVAWRITRGAR